MRRNESTTNGETRERAAELVVEGEAPSRETDGRLLRWLSESPEHVAEYLRTSLVWEALADPTLIGLEHPRRSRSSARRRRQAAAALAAGLILAAGWIAWRARGQVTYRTAVGEVASYQLEDRSVIFLNAASELSLDYTRALRRVVLSSGEASFEVAEDPHRPFVVECGATRVTAVGTEFVVRRVADVTTVTVLAGQVVVEGEFDLPPGDDPVDSTAGPSERRALPLGPKQRLAVEDSRRARLTTVETFEAVSWRQRRLIFDSERLEEVAAEFNRFNAQAIVIEDAGLRELRISGVFEANDPQSLLAFLEGSQGAVVEAGADGTTRVRRPGGPAR